LKSRSPAYRVDNVPAGWRPFWLVGSWLLGLFCWGVWNLLNLTCRIRFEGEPPDDAAGNYICSLWHESWFLYFVTFVRSHHRHVWMQHPYAYMKPAHVALGLAGVGILLGSEGEEGREAARKLTSHLRDGGSTAISPDGPHGPCHVLKKGVLHLARDSGVPILPLRFSVNRALHAGWDRKAVPLPGSTITVACGPPIVVTDANFEQAGQRLADFMTGPVEQTADFR